LDDSFSDDLANLQKYALEDDEWSSLKVYADILRVSKTMSVLA
jgi:hypothetical protein